MLVVSTNGQRVNGSACGGDLVPSCSPFTSRTGGLKWALMTRESGAGIPGSFRSGRYPFPYLFLLSVHFGKVYSQLLCPKKNYFLFLLSSCYSVLSRDCLLAWTADRMQGKGNCIAVDRDYPKVHGPLPALVWEGQPWRNDSFTHSVRKSVETKTSQQVYDNRRYLQTASSWKTQLFLWMKRKTRENMNWTATTESIANLLDI